MLIILSVLPILMLYMIIYIFMMEHTTGDTVESFRYWTLKVPLCQYESVLVEGQDCRWRLCIGQRTLLVEILWLSPSHHFLYSFALTILPSYPKCALKWQIAVRFLRNGHHFRIIPIGHNEDFPWFQSMLKHFGLNVCYISNHQNSTVWLRYRLILTWNCDVDYCCLAIIVWLW